MEKNNHFLPKRQIYLKKASEATFGDIEELKNAGTLAPEFSVKAKIEEADKVFGLSTGEFLAKYDDATYGHGLTPASTDAEFIAGKMLVIDALDKEINDLAGEDLKAKVGALDKGDPKVHEILANATSAMTLINADILGGSAEKELYLKHLRSFGLDLNDKDIKRKTELAIELKTRIREQQEKEAELAIEKLKLEQLQQDAKDIGLRYADYNGIGWKIAKVLGISAIGGAAALGAAPLAVGATGVLALGSFIPQLDFGISKTLNKFNQWFNVGVSGKEKEKKTADERVQNIQQNLSNLQARENQKKTVIEADLKRLKERRGEVELEMQPITKELKILRGAAAPDAGKINDTVVRLTAVQEKLSALDKAIGEQEKVLIVFSLAEKHREKLGNIELINSIAASEHLPGTAQQIKEVYEAPDKRSVEAQVEIKKIKPDEIRYIIEAELKKPGRNAVKVFLGPPPNVGAQLLAKPNPSPNDAGISALKANATTRPLYDLLMNMAKLSPENPFRKKAEEIIQEAFDERKKLKIAKANLKKINPAHTNATNVVKDFFNALSDNKKKDIEKAFAKMLPWNNPSNATRKERYNFFESIKKLPADDAYRRAALKMIGKVLKKKGIL